MAKNIVSFLALLSSFCCLGASAQQCGDGVGGELCDDNLCCSRWGYCGTTADYCCEGCQSQCGCNIPPPPPYVPPPPPSPPPPPRPPTPSDEGVGKIVNEALFNEMLLHRSTAPCVGGFYTYDAFLAGAAKFPEFGTTGDEETRKREVAAFMAQTSHETTGGWETAPDGRYSWGYCWIREGMTTDPSLLPSYCVPSEEWPCASGKKYYGRGPIQISYNYNYGPAGKGLGYHLLNDPDTVEFDPYVSFETAFWFWMTPQPPKPSCHDVIIGNFAPSPADIAAGRLPGFGLCTNIINGGVECGGSAPVEQEVDRLGFYERYSRLVGVEEGDNLTCAGMQPYGGLTLEGNRSEGATAGGGGVRSQ